MNNASHTAFRSHLLQQFVTSARNQARMPPIALLGWLDDQLATPNEENQSRPATSSHRRAGSSTNNHNNDSISEIQSNDDTTVCNSIRKNEISYHHHRSSREISRLKSSASVGDLSSICTSSHHSLLLSSHELSSSHATIHRHSTLKSSLLQRPPMSSSASSHPILYQQHSNNKDTTNLVNARRYGTSAAVVTESSSKDGNQSDENDNNNEEDATSDDLVVDYQTDLSKSFQNLIQTRRTSGRFHSNPPFVINSQQQQQTHYYYTKYWSTVLERAVIAGCSAPNHKKTEPFTFKRIVAPSPAYNRLLDITYNCTLYRLLGEQQSNPTEEMIQKAQRKRERWGKIPAYLVTVVNSSRDSDTKGASSSPDDSENHNTTKDINSDSELDERNLYMPMPFVPPISERELEDYAAASAAVQNCLLSLHSENLVTKWATGPVIKTPAFRQLIQADTNDRVVALIMIGSKPQKSSTNYQDDHHPNELPPTTNDLPELRPPRRLRRQFHGDILIDL